MRPHRRDTNDDVSILGADVEVLELHSVSVRQTEQTDLVKLRVVVHCKYKFI